MQATQLFACIFSQLHLLFNIGQGLTIEVVRRLRFLVAVGASTLRSPRVTSIGQGLCVDVYLLTSSTQCRLAINCDVDLGMAVVLHIFEEGLDVDLWLVRC